MAQCPQGLTSSSASPGLTARRESQTYATQRPVHQPETDKLMLQTHLLHGQTYKPTPSTWRGRHSTDRQTPPNTGSPSMDRQIPTTQGNLSMDRQTQHGQTLTIQTIPAWTDGQTDLPTTQTDTGWTDCLSMLRVRLSDTAWTDGQFHSCPAQTLSLQRLQR